MTRVECALCLVLAAIGLRAGAGEMRWPAWRGPTASGSTAEGQYPQKCDKNAVLWRAPLPGKGCSTPSVWDQRIFVTAPTNGIDSALAFDVEGKGVWHTTFGSEQSGKHRNGSGSNPSPVTDGKAVFVYFKSGTLAALDFRGKILWQTNLVAGFGQENLFWDQGTSPVLTTDNVVVARMHHGESWVAAFEKVTGKTRWLTPRNYETPVEGDNAYTTPIVIRHGGTEAILVWGGQHVTVYEPSAGKLLWSCGDFNPREASYWPAVASPVIAGEIVVVPYGRSDRGQPRLHGIRLGGAGDVTATHRAWLREDTGTFVPTPAEYGGKVYVLRDRGEVECIEPATGATVWKDAFPRSSSNYYASPVVANGVLYAIREDGVVFIAKVNGKFELVSENAMAERIIASPVPVGNRLLIRGEKTLFCIGAK